MPASSANWTDEVLVGVAEDVDRALAVGGGEVLVAQVESAEVSEQAGDDAVAVGGAAELGFVVPVGVAQDAVQSGRVGFLDLGAGHVEHLAEVHRVLDDLVPASLGRDEELVLVVVSLGRIAGLASGDRLVDLLGEAVGEALEEEGREDVVLVVR